MFSAEKKKGIRRRNGGRGFVSITDNSPINISDNYISSIILFVIPTNHVFFYY